MSELINPEIVTRPVGTGSEVVVEQPLPIRYVTSGDKDVASLGINIISAVLLVGTLWLILGKITGYPVITVGLPLVILWITLVAFHNKMWVSVDEQQAVIYVDQLFSSGELIVYLQGGHFTSWTSKRQAETINFKKNEVSGTPKDRVSTFEFPTNDGLYIVAKVRIFARRRNSKEALSRSLRWPIEELERKVEALVAKKLSDIGARNTFDVIRTNKPQVAYEVAQMFDGEGRTSDFERDTGLTIDDPIILELGLTAESKRIYESRAKVNVLKEGVSNLLESSGGQMDPTDAANAVQVASGAASQVIHTYKGIPPGATTVALGDSGVAVAGGGKGK
jgi:hypothetical protein